MAACNHELTAAQTAAADAEVDCFKREAATLDDGSTDPIAIAIAVEGACRSEISQANAAMTAGHNLAFRDRFLEKIDRETLKLAIGAVVLHRKRLNEN